MFEPERTHSTPSRVLYTFPDILHLCDWFASVAPYDFSSLFQSFLVVRQCNKVLE